jgi:dATP pyrophosphohydrolase
MARAPFQVLVYPYRQAGDGEFEYALLQRSDAGWWQAVAGGGEDSETPLEAARREAREEAGIASGADFLQLDTVEPVRVTEFRDSYLWGEKVYVIPQYG